MPKKKPLISIITPVYNEEPNILNFYGETVKVLKGLVKDYDYEFVFTDNHSTDNTFSLLQQVAAKDKRVRVYRFSKNFGYQRSILTGYRQARGDVAVQLDCDLQDPPAMIPEMLTHWQQGNEVVYGIRKQRREGLLISAIRRIFYWFIDAISAESLPRDAGDFRLLDRKIIDALNLYQVSEPYLRGTIATMGFRQVGIPYARSARQAGDSKIRLGQMIKIALDGIINHSIIPLRLATFVSAILMSVIYLIGKFVYGAQWAPGFATTTILILISVSINALFLGIIGEYLARIYKEVRKEPTVIIEATLNEKTKRH